MDEQGKARVVLPRARTGRPRPTTSFAPQDLVRIEIRLPATMAALLYAAAGARNQSLSQVVEGLLTADPNAGEAPTTS